MLETPIIPETKKLLSQIKGLLFKLIPALASLGPPEFQPKAAGAAGKVAKLNVPESTTEMQYGNNLMTPPAPAPVSAEPTPTSLVAPAPAHADPDLNA